MLVIGLTIARVVEVGRLTECDMCVVGCDCPAEIVVLIQVVIVHVTEVIIERDVLVYALGPEDVVLLNVDRDVSPVTEASERKLMFEQSIGIGSVHKAMIMHFGYACFQIRSNYLNATVTRPLHCNSMT